MDFFKYIKKFLIFTLKEIYSFFLKLSLLFFIFFIISIGMITAITTKMSKETKISTNYEYVVFNPKNIVEDKIISSSIFGSLNDDKYNISFTDILNSLDDIQNNNKIKGIIINIDQTNISSSKIEEINKKLEQLKANGKKIYSYGAFYNNNVYNLASVSDEIISVPSSSASVDISGYNYSSLYYKELFDKLGINMEVVRIGDFKSFGENFTNKDMTPELRSELTRILDKRYNNLISNISKHRKIDENTLKSDIENGNNIGLTPFIARDKNFVDKLEYFSDFLARINTTDDKVIDIYDYYSENKENINNNIENKLNSKGTIAVIYAEGNILYESNDPNTNNITPTNISKKLEEVSKIKDLKGVVLRVNSGGGSALASEMIYQSLSKLNVPIYISMSETAASGGYYIAMSGAKVFANKATITGSIGVVSMIPKLDNAQNKIGINANNITKGKFSDMHNAFTPLSEEAKSKIVESMTNTYNEFKSRVTNSRKISDTTLEQYAQGKIWLGNEAVDIQLVDDIASLDETIKILAKDLNLGTNYNIKNIYSKQDLSEIIRLLSSYIIDKSQLEVQLKSISNLMGVPYNGNIASYYHFIEENKNKPIYYLPFEMNIF